MDKEPPRRCATSKFHLLILFTYLPFQGNPIRPFEEASLLALNSTSEGLSKALKELDQVSTRTQDTVLVFYVKAEQGDAHEIIENQVSNH